MSRWVTERDILALARGATLHLPRGSLLTPSAQDAVKLREIALVREGLASTPAESLSRPCRCGELKELKDGEYLLRVHEGDFRVRRIEP